MALFNYQPKVDSPQLLTVKERYIVICLLGEIKFSQQINRKCQDVYVCDIAEHFNERLNVRKKQTNIPFSEQKQDILHF